jgi:anaerobic selenocysteine-containing dehydrogenase
MLATADPPLRLAWVERSNPIPQNPETPAVIRAFRALDFRVVVDEVLTDTAREADIVLPAKTFLEQTDVIGAYWHDYLQLRPRVIDPPGEVRPESAIYRELALRLGISRAVVEETFPGDSDASVERYLARRLAGVPAVTLEALRAGPVRVPDVDEVAFADRRFPTPSGRIELLSAEAIARWQVDPLPGYAEPVETVTPDGHDSARFPFVLLTPNSKNRIHSQFGHLPSLRAIDPAPLLHIHPEDAAERGIGDGTRVRVFNDRGELTLAARLDYGLRLGCLVVHNGWWIADGGAVNLLSAARETDMGHGAAFHENVVNVEVAP